MWIEVLFRSLDAIEQQSVMFSSIKAAEQAINRCLQHGMMAVDATKIVHLEGGSLLEQPLIISFDKENKYCLQERKVS